MKNNTLDTIKLLRTIHWDFNDRQVSKTDVEIIVEHSLRTANSDNLTDYSVVVVTDPDVLNTISGGESGGRALTCLVYAIDYTRIVKCAHALGYDKFQPSKRLYNFFIALYDVCAAAQTAVITAKSMGIDSLITNFTHRYNPDSIMELLNMPKEYCFPVIQVVLGYSDKDPSITTGRLSKNHVIHFDKYRPENMIDTQTIIGEMDGIYPEYINAEYKHALDWFFNKWFVEWYNEDVYKKLCECLTNSNLLREPFFKGDETK
jgi:nitroreductase